jgi:hypothetical protein
MDMSSNGAISAMQNPVQNQPYAAGKVTHSIWKLSDGTTIRHDSETKIARDTEGRVREDVQVAHASSIGGEQVNLNSNSVMISDPVDHSMTTWTGTAKIAVHMQLPDFSSLSKIPVLHGGVMGGTPHAVRLGTTDPDSPALTSRVRAEKDTVKIEDLGQQSLAGVLATGKRTTTTIPTGKIGNDQPITIVHEEWYSPDLKVVVKSTDSDPRSGDRTMELEGLTRGDPDPSLFHAPEGYTVKDMSQVMKSVGDMGKKPSDQQ